MISPEMVAPMLGMVLMDDEQRATVEAQIAAYFTARGVYGIALADDSGFITHRFVGPDVIASGFVGILAGELGIALPGYKNVLNPVDATEQT